MEPLRVAGFGSTNQKSHTFMNEAHTAFQFPVRTPRGTCAKKGCWNGVLRGVCLGLPVTNYASLLTNFLTLNGKSTKRSLITVLDNRPVSIPKETTFDMGGLSINLDQGLLRLMTLQEGHFHSTSVFFIFLWLVLEKKVMELSSNQLDDNFELH